MKCEKCLYRANCQFLSKHKNAEVEGCTAFKDRTNFAKVQHGCWEVYEYEAFPLVVFLYRCSLCKADAPAERGAVYAQVKTAYCPNCGAKMDGKRKDGVDNE